MAGKGDDEDPMDDMSPHDGNTGVEDDPVVREIDVYLTTALADQLYILQYPNRPFYRPYDLPLAARMKPANRILELDIDLPRGRDSGGHYDEEAPRHLRIDKLKLTSTYTTPNTHYAVGAMQGNELHLTPVAGIFQMRPSCRHVDEGGGMDADVEGEISDSEDEDAPPEKTKLQHVELKKKESEKALAARRTSYAYKRQQEEAEPWVELQVHGFDSAASLDEYDRMFCTATERKVKWKGGSMAYPDVYRLDSLNGAGAGYDYDREGRMDGGGGTEESKASEGAKKKGGGVGLGMVGAITPSGSGTGKMGLSGDSSPGGSTSSMVAPSSIKSMKGMEQINAIMERAVVVSFAQVLDIIGGDAERVEVLESVKKVAVLVRGNWVRKSSLYVYSPKLMDARDALLILMERYGAINRLQVGKALGLDVGEVLLLLQDFATLDRAHRRWQLKVPDDPEFLWAFPEVARQQQGLLKEKERELSSLLSILGEPDCPYPGPIKLNDPHVELHRMYDRELARVRGRQSHTPPATGEGLPAKIPRASKRMELEAEAMERESEPKMDSGLGGGDTSGAPLPPSAVSSSSGGGMMMPSATPGGKKSGGGVLLPGRKMVVPPAKTVGGGKFKPTLGKKKQPPPSSS